MTTSSNAGSAYGAQMAKYFTMNQPAYVAIDSAVSVVRPQMAITRLIARSGIPERTASIPSEKAYVVSVHLNHANSGEWELWTDGKYAKTGAWPVGGVAMCDLESNSSIRNPGPIDWIHYHVPRATLDSLTDDAGMPRVKRLHCIYGTSDPAIYHLTQLIMPTLNRPAMFCQLFMDSLTMTICSHLVAQYGQTPGAISQFKGGLAPWLFMQLDHGAILRKETGRETPKMIRFVIGNPLIMKEMVKHVPDAGSYAPVTVLVDERADGVHLSYDRMASFLAPYGNRDALEVARNLDRKIEDLLRQAAA
jgi:uncharacterized protein (DUF302 family)